MNIPKKYKMPMEAIWLYRRIVGECIGKHYRAKSRSFAQWRKAIGAPQIKNDYKFP